jgi:hypothetical protein
MTDHNLFYYPYASFTNAQLPLLKVAALYFDKLVILDPVGASWDTVGADHLARDAVRLFNSPSRLGVNAMNPNLNQHDDGKAVDIMQAQGRRDALTEARNWVLGWIVGVYGVHPNLRLEGGILRYRQADVAGGTYFLIANLAERNRTAGWRIALWASARRWARKRETKANHD